MGPCRYLENDQLKSRLRNVQSAKKSANRMISRLDKKLKSLIEEEGIELSEEDASDMNDLVVEVDEARKARDHFQNIFWEQQRKYNSLHNKRTMRWHPLMIRFALNLKYLSSCAYKAVGNVLALPSRRTLCDYTHVMSVDSGVSHEMISRMKKDMNFQTCTAPEKMVSIMLDEMKLKSGLVFNQREGRMVGFVNLGSVNGDLDVLQTSLTGEGESSQQPELAGSMLVLMVRLLRRPSFTFPVAQYPTSSLSGPKLYPILWDPIEALEINGLSVMSVTCDGLLANRNLFGIGRGDAVARSLPYTTANPFDKERSIYYFCDPPHLIKTARNCFSNSFSNSYSRKLKVSFSKLSTS